MDYNKMSKKHHDNEEVQKQLNELTSPLAEVVNEPIEETVEPMMLEGAVSGCAQMYVRSEASVDSEPLGIIKCGTKVQIYESESTSDFYSVCTETGLEGFCMKKFISIL